MWTNFDVKKPFIALSTELVFWVKNYFCLFVYLRGVVAFEAPITEKAELATYRINKFYLLLTKLKYFIKELNFIIAHCLKYFFVKDKNIIYMRVLAKCYATFDRKIFTSSFLWTF